LKIFYIGSAGPLSLQPLNALLNRGHDICGVGVDRQQPPTGQQSLTLLASQEAQSVEVLARAKKVPLVDLSQPLPEVINEVTGMEPDMILVSCYEHRLADELLAMSPLGAFNIHPSLLPAFRGPVPLFWQFRVGIDHFGLSLHRMTGQLDAGPVICRQSVQMPDGVTMAEATLRLASQTKSLLENALPLISRQLRGEEQNEVDASYQTFPQQEDFEVSTAWPARRIFNFMRATAHMGQIYRCQYNGMDLRLRHALTYSADGISDGSVDPEITIEIACSPGTLVASYY